MKLNAKIKTQEQLIADAKAEGVRIGNIMSHRTLKEELAINAIRWCCNILVEMLQYLAHNREAQERLTDGIDALRKAERAVSQNKSNS